MLYNIHSHHNPTTEDILTIRNFRYGVDHFQPQHPYSIGIHPWDADKYSVDDNFLLLAHNSVAIGECGLDKCCQVPINQQFTAFINQINIANQFHKPIIIHCVKYFSKIDDILKTVTPQTPWIFHSFYGPTDWITAHKDNTFFYSISPKTLTFPRINPIIKNIPPDKLLLETDEDSDIANVYKHFEGLEAQIEENFFRLFPNIQEND